MKQRILFLLLTLLLVANPAGAAAPTVTTLQNRAPVL